MRIGIVGAGAIGVWVGGCLAKHGYDVSALARGKTLTALRTHGWRYMQDGKAIQQPARAGATPSEIGEQDVVLVAVKSGALAEVAPSVPALCHGETVVVPAMNGVPWWFLNSLPGRESEPPLRCLDPDGVIRRAIPLDLVVGCVVHAAASSPEPGVSQVNVPGRIVLGELDGAWTSRIAMLQRIFSNAGLTVQTSERVQQEVWKKLLANMIFNPLSALARASTDRLVDDPLLQTLIATVHAEGMFIANKLGLNIGETLAERLQSVRRLGYFKTSMLQDLEAGGRLEIDTLLGAPRELAERLRVETPGIDLLLGLLRLLSENT